MRPIEFRGLRVDGKGWVYGSLVHGEDGIFILESGYNVNPQEPEYHYSAMGCGLEDRDIHDRYDAMLHGWEKAVEKFHEELPDFVEVLPETVGQYTGMKDRNGVKIWEGDILEFDTGQQGFISKDPVVWREDSCRFNFGTGLSWRDARYLEVIGNIHEEERQR